MKDTDRVERHAGKGEIDRWKTWIKGDRQKVETCG